MSSPGRFKARRLSSLSVLCLAWTAFQCGTLIYAVGDGNDLLPDIPAGAQSVQLQLLVDLNPNFVIEIMHAADGSGRLFLVSPDGVIRIFTGGSVLPTPFLNAPASPTDRAMSRLAPRRVVSRLAR